MDIRRYLNAVSERHANVEPLTFTDSDGNERTIRNAFWNNDGDYFTIIHLNDDDHPLITVFSYPNDHDRAFAVSKPHRDPNPK